MANRKFKFDIFDQKSISNVIKQLYEYRGEINKKCEEVCRRLSDIGIETATQAINEGNFSTVVTLKANIDPTTIGCNAILIATGREVTLDDGRVFNLLFAIEFGAGIKYNPTSNPKSAEFGFGVGTFPGQKHALDPNGWNYLGDDGEWHHSYGIRATMPMYKAAEEIRKNINNIVNDVFRK